MKVVTTICLNPEIHQKAKQRYKSLSAKIESLLRADLDIPLEEDHTLSENQIKDNESKISAYKSLQIELERATKKLKDKQKARMSKVRIIEGHA